MSPGTRRAVTALLVLSVAGTVLFGTAYVLVPLPAPDHGWLSDHLLGTGLAMALLGLGLALVAVAVHVLGPAAGSSQPRELTPGATPEAAAGRPAVPAPESVDRLVDETVVAAAPLRDLLAHRTVRRLFLAAVAVLPIPFLFTLRDLGPPRDSLLERDAWYPGARLVDLDTGEPVRLGDLAVGGVATVMPEGRLRTDVPVNAESYVVVVRLPPGLNEPLPGHEDWAVEGYVAYSKVCTHAGCPAAQYNQLAHLLLCPCHQSTFDVPRGCRVVFGPAPHPLPQLPIYADAQGYLRARGGFPYPPGPPFWQWTDRGSTAQGA